MHAGKRTESKINVFSNIYYLRMICFTVFRFDLHTAHWDNHSRLTYLLNNVFKTVFIIHHFIHRFSGEVAYYEDVVMPRSESTAMDSSCQALCRTLVSQNGLQPENVDISQSVLYTSIMGLLLVTDKEVRQRCAVDTICLISVFDTWNVLYIGLSCQNLYVGNQRLSLSANQINI